MSEPLSVSFKAPKKGAKYTEEQIKRALAHLLEDRAKKVLSDIRTSMLKPKTGKTYTRNGKTWTASAPGEAPAVGPTGKLKGSLRMRKSNEGLRIRISAEIGYGKRLEKGTTGGKILARPFMAPAIAVLKPLNNRDAINAIRRGILNR